MILLNGQPMVSRDRIVLLLRVRGRIQICVRRRIQIFGRAEGGYRFLAVRGRIQICSGPTENMCINETRLLTRFAV